MTTTTPNTTGFASLAELQERHVQLSQAIPKGAVEMLSASNIEHVVEFVRKCVATGAQFDAIADRIAKPDHVLTTKIGAAIRDMKPKSSGCRRRHSVEPIRRYPAGRFKEEST